MYDERPDDNAYWETLPSPPAEERRAGGSEQRRSGSRPGDRSPAGPTPRVGLAGMTRSYGWETSDSYGGGASMYGRQPGYSPERDWREAGAGAGWTGRQGWYRSPIPEGHGDEGVADVWAEEPGEPYLGSGNIFARTGEHLEMGGITGSPGPAGRARWRPGPHTGRGPRGWQRSEERIREDACELLARHPRVDACDVEVAVEAGEIVLRGTVPDRAQKRLAEDAVEAIPGVRDVRNELRVGAGEHRHDGDGSSAGRSEQRTPGSSARR